MFSTVPLHSLKLNSQRSNRHNRGLELATNLSVELVVQADRDRSSWERGGRPTSIESKDKHVPMNELLLKDTQVLEM